MKRFFVALCLSFATSLTAAPVQIALTFDDLPYVWDTPPHGYSNKQMIAGIVSVLAKHKIAGAYAFANAGKTVDRDSKEILDLWVNSGHLFGNHTWNHADLNTVSLNDYLSEIDRNHEELSGYGQRFTHYFRYPFLHEGNTQEKRTKVRNHLFKNDYQISQVTIDFSDYLWYGPYARCLAKTDNAAITWLKESYVSEAKENLKAAMMLSEFLFGRQVKHIALFHPNLMTAEQLDAVLTTWRAQGAEFISLTEAMSDPVYKIDPNVVRESPNLFTNQIRLMRGLQNPPQVLEIFQHSTQVETRLEKVCI